MEEMSIPKSIQRSKDWNIRNWAARKKQCKKRNFRRDHKELLTTMKRASGEYGVAVGPEKGKRLPIQSPVAKQLKGTLQSTWRGHKLKPSPQHVLNERIRILGRKNSFPPRLRVYSAYEPARILLSE